MSCSDSTPSLFSAFVCFLGGGSSSPPAEAKMSPAIPLEESLKKFQERSLQESLYKKHGDKLSKPNNANKSSAKKNIEKTTRRLTDDEVLRKLIDKQLEKDLNKIYKTESDEMSQSDFSEKKVYQILDENSKKLNSVYAKADKTFDKLSHRNSKKDMPDAGTLLLEIILADVIPPATPKINHVQNSVQKKDAHNRPDQTQINNITAKKPLDRSKQTLIHQASNKIQKKNYASDSNQEPRTLREFKKHARENYKKSLDRFQSLLAIADILLAPAKTPQENKKIANNLNSIPTEKTALPKFTVETLIEKNQDDAKTDGATAHNEAEPLSSEFLAFGLFTSIKESVSTFFSEDVPYFFVETIPNLATTTWKSLKEKITTVFSTSNSEATDHATPALSPTPAFLNTSNDKP